MFLKESGTKTGATGVAVFIKKKDVLAIFILLQETKNSNLFDKNYT